MSDLVYILYFAGIVDNLKQMLILFPVFITFLVTVIVFFTTLDREPEELLRNLIKASKIYLTGFFLIFLLAFLIPSSRTLYMMSAAYLANKTYTQFQDTQVVQQLEKIVLSKLENLENESKEKCHE